MCCGDPTLDVPQEQKDIIGTGKTAGFCKSQLPTSILISIQSLRTVVDRTPLQNGRSIFSPKAQAEGFGSLRVMSPPCPSWQVSQIHCHSPPGTLPRSHLTELCGQFHIRPRSSPKHAQSKSYAG